MRNGVFDLNLPVKCTQTFRMRPIDTERLILREFHEGDVRDLVDWDEPAGARYTEVDALGFIDFCFREYLKWGMGPWAIILKQTGRVIGSCGFCGISLNQKSAEVNYYVAPSYRQRGFATEAVKGLCEFGFKDLGLGIVRARCDTSNWNSERVMQKAGMKFERLILAKTPLTDDSLDTKLYSIAKADFRFD